MEFSERGSGEGGAGVVNTGWGWGVERYWRGAMAMEGVWQGTCVGDRSRYLSGAGNSEPADAKRASVTEDRETNGGSC